MATKVRYESASTFTNYVNNFSLLSGNDYIQIDDAETNYIYGHNGNDTIVGSNSSDQVVGGAGDDILDGRNGSDDLFGGNGNDLIFGGTGTASNRLYGNTGNDEIYGADGNDLIDGGANDDILRGGFGADTIIGGSGNDTLYADGGLDNMNGGTGDDFFVFDGNGSADIEDTSGIDVVYLGSYYDSGWGVVQEGDDLIIGIADNINAGQFANTALIKDFFVPDADTVEYVYSDGLYYDLSSLLLA